MIGWSVTMWWLPLLNWILTDDSVLHTLHVNISHREKLILKTLVIVRHADIYVVNNIHDQHDMRGPRRCHIFLGSRMNTWHFSAGSPPRFFMFPRLSFFKMSQTPNFFWWSSGFEHPWVSFIESFKLFRINILAQLWGWKIDACCWILALQPSSHRAIVTSLPYDDFFMCLVYWTLQ